MDLYLGRDDQQAGPFTQEAVVELIRSGQVEKTDKLWYEGLTAWCCLGMRPEYQAYFEEAGAVRNGSGTRGDAARVVPEEAAPPPLPPGYGDGSSGAAAVAAVGAATAAATLGESESSGGSDGSDAPDSDMPRKYRPGMRALKEEENETSSDDDDWPSTVKPVEDASKSSQIVAGLLDGLILSLCLWLLGTVFLPKGLSVAELAGHSDYDDYYSIYDDPEFEEKMAALEDRFYEDDVADWEDYEAEVEALEKEWETKHAANMDAGDRFMMGTTTPEDDSKITRYYFIAAIFGVLFSLFQYYNLAKRGQTLGKMFMNIKMINEATQDVPGHNLALIIHTFYPRFRLAEMAVVKA